MTARRFLRDFVVVAVTLAACTVLVFAVGALVTP